MNIADYLVTIAIGGSCAAIIWLFIQGIKKFTYKRK